MKVITQPFWRPYNVKRQRNDNSQNKIIKKKTIVKKVRRLLLIVSI
jgi:hypothetical protein